MQMQKTIQRTLSTILKVQLNVDLLQEWLWIKTPCHGRSLHSRWKSQGEKTNVLHNLDNFKFI